MFEDDAIGECRIADIELQDQLAATPDPGRQGEARLAVGDLLVGNLQGPAIFQHRFKGETSDLAEVGPCRLADGDGRTKNKLRGKKLHRHTSKPRQIAPKWRVCAGKEVRKEISS
jgi:hypothetical protein